jgi:hypothetical protein
LISVELPPAAAAESWDGVIFEKRYWESAPTAEVDAQETWSSRPQFLVTCNIQRWSFLELTIYLTNELYILLGIFDPENLIPLSTP